MDTIRYWLALLLLISLPPALLLWLVVHPFARFWRHLGPGWTYAIMAVPSVALGFGVFRARDLLLTIEFGTSTPLLVLGAVCFAGRVAIAFKRRRHLTFDILIGTPELSSRRYPGALLQEGVYGMIRHPRYAETLLGITGYALIANYLACYCALAASLPIGYLLILTEERELRDRFGAEYDAYRRRVPCLVPRPGGNSEAPPAGET